MIINSTSNLFLCEVFSVFFGLFKYLFYPLLCSLLPLHLFSFNAASPERGRLSNNHQNNKTVMDGNGPEVGRRATMMSQQQRETVIKGERMDEEEEMRIWRNSMEPMQAFARRMSCVSSLGCWRSGAGANHHLMLRSTTPTQNEHPMAGGGGPPSPTATSKPKMPTTFLLALCTWPL